MTLTLNSASVPWAALLPIVALAVGFVVYCLIDLARSRVRYLPKWAWAIICLFSVPLGGIIYLLVGREHTDGRT
jgi:Phospholipase_D-nuclease N-terminal